MKRVHDKFPEMQEFEKAYIKECCKENISGEEAFLSSNNNC